MEIYKEQIRFYLNQLFRLEEGYIEFRPIKGSEVRTKFFKNPCNPKQPLNFINSLQGKWNIYVGVNLRSLRRSKERFLKSVGTFFADVDAKDFEGGREEAREVIDNFVLTPSMIIDSGNGFHVYWILEDSFDINHRGDLEEAKQVSAKLHKEINADQTYDLGRVLRCPGLENVKDPDNPKLCSVDSFSFNTYDFRQLQDVLPDGKVNLNSDANLDFSTESDIEGWDDIRGRIPEYIVDRIQEIPEQYKNDRSANDYWIANKLLECGFNDQEIIDSFKLFAKLSYGGGLKTKEYGEQYIRKTISSAKADKEDKEKMVNDLNSIKIIE